MVTKKTTTLISKTVLIQETMQSALSTTDPGGEGGGINNFIWGRLRPEVQPLTLLYTIVDRKGSPSVYLLLTNGAPLTYLV